VDQLEALCSAGKFKEGLALAEPLLGEVANVPYEPIRAQVQQWTGRMLEGIGQYERAKALFEDAVRSAVGGGDEVLAAEAWSWLLFVVGERQQQFAEAVVLRKWGPLFVHRARDPRVEALWLNAEGNVLHRSGDEAKAQAAHERALVLREKMLGPDHADVARSLNNLGLVFASLGKYRRAQAVQERSLSILEKALGPDNPLVAQSCANVALVSYSLGEYGRAQALLERALPVQETALGPEHPLVAYSWSHLGLVLHALGEYGKARSAHERALAIREKALGPDHLDVAASLSNLGVVFYSLGEYDRAQALLERGLSIWQKAFGPAPTLPIIADPLSHLSRVLIQKKQLDAALPLFQRALALRETGQGPSQPDLALPLLAGAELRLAQNRPDEAALLLERALSLDDALFKPEIQLTLAEVLWSLGKDRPRAISLAEEVRAGYARIGHAPGLAKATRWLDQRSQPSGVP
jgi:serine/threonine-protein kinase